ncbi:MAG: prepilin-type N-terminal cleavage/methylation domain-containing protein [Planctomycetes bacterium]|nr:prepilin-type N-terminal cleavage/methylation domain-containing protein [Planctomycetota bacterium]
MKNKLGFTLIELVVVILILGILAGVAAPKLFNTSAKATDNSARTTLTIIRDAIELYAAENGGTPPAWTDQATFYTDILPFLRGNVFPNCPVGTQAGANTILNGAATTGTGGAWRYNAGEFFINDSSASASGIGNYDTF